MGWLDAAGAFAQNVGNTIVSVATAPFAVAYQAGQQVSPFVTSSQPTTVSGQQYVSAPTQQLSSGGVASPQSYVEQAQAMISPAIPTIQNTLLSAPFVLNPITAPIMAGTFAAGALGIKSPLATEQAIAAQTMQPIAAQPSLRYLSPLEPNIYSEQALQEVRGRYGYTEPSQLGDIRTQQIEKQYQLAYNTLNIMGVSIATPDTMMGRTLEAQRQGAVDTRSHQFYSGELQKWVQNQVELSSAYHVAGAKAAIPIPSNPYEYRGDLAVEFLKGTPTRSSEYFSPVSGEMVSVLPKGVGLQQEGWNVAKTGQLSTLDYNAAINKLASAGYGPYGALWGGPEYKETGFNAPQSLMAPIKAPFVSTPPTSIVAPAQFDVGFQVKGYAAQPSVDIGNLPTPFKSTYSPTPVNEFADFGGFGGGLIGHTIWGPQSPNVIRGLISASVSDATAGLVNITGIVPGSAQGKPYGEFSSWSTSAGEVVTARRGYTKEQLEIYGYGLESKPVSTIQDVTDRLSYGFVKTMSTNPGAIASGAGAGAIWAVGGEAIGGAAGAVAAGGGRLAPIAARAVAFGESSLGTILPLAAFGGLTTYSASEGFTATPSKTLINIGADIPGLAAMGVSAVGTKMAIQSGALGFQTKKTEYISGFEPRTIDLTGLTPVERPLATSPPSGVPTLAEPYVVVGKTRYGYEALKSEVSPEPFATLPGVRPLLSGSEMGSVSQSARMGFVEPGKTQSTTAFILGSRGAPLEFQPESVQTQLFKMGLLEDIRTIPLPRTEPTSIAGVKMASPQPFAGLAEQMGLRIEPAGIGRSTERGLEISGAPMSQRMLEMTTTIGGIKSGGYTSLEEVIGSSATAARVKPATQAAEAQMILPSATKQTFKENILISPKAFEQVLTGVFESEKRIPVSTPKWKPITAMDMGLGEFGPTRTIFEKSTRPYEHVYSREITKLDYGPTRATFEQAMMARQSMQLLSVASISRSTQLQASTQLPSTATLPTQLQQQIGGINQNTISSPIQTNIPSVAQRTDMFRLTTQTPSTASPNPQRPDMFAITNPYGTSAPKPPKEPTPDMFRITPPPPPPPIPPSPKYPSYPPPPIPGFPLFPSFSHTLMGGGSPRGFKKFTEYMSFGGLGWKGKMTVGTNARRIGKLKVRKKK